MLGDILFPDVLDEAKAESGWADTILAGAFAPPPAGFAPAAHGIAGKGARYAVRVFDDRARISPAGRTETDYVDAFLDEFGARRGKPVLFEDALFRDAAGKYKVTQGGTLAANPQKARLSDYAPLIRPTGWSLTLGTGTIDG